MSIKFVLLIYPLVLLWFTAGVWVTNACCDRFGPLPWRYLWVIVWPPVAVYLLVAGLPVPGPLRRRLAGRAVARRLDGGMTTRPTEPAPEARSRDGRDLQDNYLI